MSNWSMIAIVLLIAGTGLAYGSCNTTGESPNSARAGNGHDLTINRTNCQNYSCLNETNGQFNCEGIRDDNNSNSTCVGANINNGTIVCICQDNTSCSKDNCIIRNCTYPNLDAGNNSSMSSAGNGPCSLDLKYIRNLLSNTKKGRVFTMTLKCPNCN